MIRLTLDGLVGFDGTYDLDLEESPLTNRELHWIKEIAGVRLGEFESAADAGDNDLLVAFTAIALVRYGKAKKEQVTQITEFLWDTAGGKIQAEEVVEDDAGPPELEIQPPSETGSSENQPSSSGVLNGTGDTQLDLNPVSTGDLS